VLRPTDAQRQGQTIEFLDGVNLEVQEDPDAVKLSLVLQFLLLTMALLILTNAPWYTC
jgi:hypothetical protein